jgi:gliding motility-associated-like protein
MRLNFFYTIIFLLPGFSIPASGQGDIVPPATPLFTQVSVQPETGKTLLSWNLSPSADVAGYVIYYLKNGEGFAVDTIHNPSATSYLNLGSFSSFIIESYVIAAIDSSGNISPLSNELHTIFTSALIDTCNKRITISWNKYNSYPRQVTSYRILSSLNGGAFVEEGVTSSDVNNLTINNFTANATYCFETVAILEGGFTSVSNKTCLQTGMQRAPDWINADYASVDEKNNITLSFSVDPLSEINSFRLERKTENENDFLLINQIETVNRQLTFTDKTAEPFKKNYYRLLAVNNCGNPVVSSNLSVNIVPKLVKEDNILNISWTPYKFWSGRVYGYKVYINTGNGFHEESSLPATDSVLTINYSSVMYEITGSNLCFYIIAFETDNPHGIAGQTASAIICTEISETITVPNAFTPNNDLKNDLFKPFLSFTASEYLLVITDRQNNILFESNDQTEEWDGKRKGDPVAQGVYLWFLKLKTPSGKQITKSGTVTIIK